MLSWNISEDAFVAEADEFRQIVEWANPTVMLLDEVAPNASHEELRQAMPSALADGPDSWTLSFGTSGGRQRSS